MRIIPQNKPDPAIEHRISCNNCGTLLAYYPMDVKRYDGVDMAGGPDGCEWITCLSCKHNIQLRSW